PVLKHSIVLRLFFGHLTRPERLITILNEYAASLEQSLAELTAVREGLGGGEQFRFPALCAGWGQAYSQAELTIARQPAWQLAAQESPQPAPVAQPAVVVCVSAVAAAGRTRSAVAGCQSAHSWDRGVS